jgi:hypothetical protein
LATPAPPQHFDLPAGDAATALRLAAQQAGREIMFPFRHNKFPITEYHCY